VGVWSLLVLKVFYWEVKELLLVPLSEICLLGDTFWNLFVEGLLEGVKFVGLKVFNDGGVV
jgi:hypothetical protein